MPDDDDDDDDEQQEAGLVSEKKAPGHSQEFEFHQTNGKVSSDGLTEERRA